MPPVSMTSLSVGSFFRSRRASTRTCSSRGRLGEPAVVAEHQRQVSADPEAGRVIDRDQAGPQGLDPLELRQGRISVIRRVKVTSQIVPDFQGLPALGQGIDQGDGLLGLPEHAERIGEPTGQGDRGLGLRSQVAARPIPHPLQGPPCLLPVCAVLQSRTEIGPDRLPSERMRQAEDAHAALHDTPIHVTRPVELPQGEVYCGEGVHRAERVGVIRPIPEFDGDDRLEERRRLLEVTDTTPDPGEVVDYLKGPGMLRARHPLPDRQQVLEAGPGLVLVQAGEGRCQDAHRLEGLLMLRSQRLAGGRQDGVQKCTGFLGLTLSVEGPAQGILGGDRLGVLRAEANQSQLDGPPRELFRLPILAQFLVGLPQGMADRRLDQTPFGEYLGDLLLGSGQELVHRRHRPLGPRRAGGADHVVDQEVDDLAGLGGAAVRLLAGEIGPVPLPGHLDPCGPFGLQPALSQLLGAHRPDGLPGAHRRADDQRRRHHGRRRQHRPVPPRGLPQAVRGRRRPGLHRLMIQVAAQVGRQGVGRLVPPVAVLLQALHHDPVQLAAHGPVQVTRVGLAIDRDGRPRRGE